MDPNADNQPNVEPTTPASPATPEPGNQGAEPGAPGSVPSDSPGTPPDPRDETIKTQKKDIKNLNQAVIDARRDGRKTPTTPGQEGDPFDSEAGKYAVSLELSDSRLRGGLEERIKLYPELPAEEVQRIRLNPWAFASRKSFLSGDYEAAQDEIEQAMLDRVEEIKEEKAKSAETPQGQEPAGEVPAQVSANPAPDVTVEATPGSDEDENNWTMPLDKLKQKAEKAVASMSQQPK